MMFLADWKCVEWRAVSNNWERDCVYCVANLCTAEDGLHKIEIVSKYSTYLYILQK